MKLNIGCGRSILEGWVNIDSWEAPGVDMIKNLDCASGVVLPFAESSVDEILMSHVLEHIQHPLPLMQELHRVAKPGARITIYCPYGASDEADEDPTHVRRIFPRSFHYFGQPYYWRADYGYRGDWKALRTILVLNEWVKMELAEAAFAVKTQRNIVGEICCAMEAVKPIREQKQELQNDCMVEIATINQWRQIAGMAANDGN